MNWKRISALAVALSVAGPLAAQTRVPCTSDNGAGCYLPKVADDNNASYQGAVAMTVGGSALTSPARAVAASCIGAGDVTLKMADASSLVWGVSIGFQFQPFAATQITASTATCTYQGLR